MAWFGTLIIVISLPLARGQVKGRDYNYRPWKPFIVSAELSDRISRQGAQAAIAFSLLFVGGGLLVVILGLVDAGQWTRYIFIGYAILWLALVAGAYFYAWVAARREQRKI